MRKLLILSCALLMLMGCGSPDKEDEIVITPNENPIKTTDTVIDYVEDEVKQPTLTEEPEYVDNEHLTEFGNFYLLNEWDKYQNVAISEDNYTVIAKPMVELPEGYEPQPLTYLTDATAGTEITIEQAEEIIRILVYYGQHSEQYPSGNYNINGKQSAEIRNLIFGTTDSIIWGPCIVDMFGSTSGWLTIVDKNGDPALRFEMNIVPTYLTWFFTEYTTELYSAHDQETYGITLEHMYDRSVPFSKWFAERFE